MPDPTTPAATATMTVGEAVIALLEAAGVQAAFGVISIHNMPLLDAIAARGRIRFVPARGEAGAANMADAQARAAGSASTGAMGVCITSTGTGCGNAAGALVEALTAGTPLLHLTGQIEAAYLDRDLAYIHEARDQLGTLKSVSKAAFRVRTPDAAVGIVRQAIQLARTAPTGPVSVEIPIDVQQALIPVPPEASLSPLPCPPAQPDAAALDALAAALMQARRPLLWLGGGARHAGRAAQRLLALGFGLVTSTQGRGVVPEDHPRCLGAFSVSKPVVALYGQCDALLAVGTRLRGNETLKYTLQLPQPLYRIDADASADQRGYANAQFVHGDAELALSALADRLEAAARRGAWQTDPAFGDALAQTKAAAQALLADDLGPYAALLAAVQARLKPEDFWVRDVTLSNSIWGNRAPVLQRPQAGIHALGGGIGQGLAMGIGAAVAATAQGQGRAWTLVGDGGLVLNLGELATAVQEKSPLTLLLMNDRGYGVIKNIQDAHYGGRKVYVDLHTPDYALLCQSIGLPHRRVSALSELDAALDAAPSVDGPAVVEIDMLAIGPFKTTFAGPPVKVAGSK